MLVTLQKGSDNIELKKNIVFEIKTLDNMISRQIINHTRQANIPFVLTPVQLKILHYLCFHYEDIVYQRDIEKIIESRRSTTSGILDTMEKNNLIKRINSNIDARSKQVILTDYSYKLAKTTLKQKEAFDNIIQKSIAPEELEIFFKVTNKIKNNIMNMK